MVTMREETASHCPHPQGPHPPAPPTTGRAKQVVRQNKTEISSAFFPSYLFKRATLHLKHYFPNTLN